MTIAVRGIIIPAHILILCSLLTPLSALLAGPFADPAHCNIEDTEGLLDTSVRGFDRRDERLLGHSAEGGTVVFYSRRNDIAVIVATLYGETGRSEYNYYIDPSDPERIVVDLTSYDYTALITHPRLRIASSRNYKFVICEGRRPNYPNSIDYKDVHDRAIDLLETIRELIGGRPALRSD